MNDKGWRAFLVLVLSLGVLGLSGCLDANGGQIYHAVSGDRDRMADTCKRLAGIGEFTKFREEIRGDMNELRGLLRVSDLEAVRPRISELTNRIQTDSQSMAKLVDPQFSQPSSSSTLRWRIRPEQMGLAPQGEISTWNVINAEVVGVYNWQGALQGAVDGAQAWVRHNAVEVTLARSNVSALEVCQLQDTMVLDLLVTFQGYFGSTSQMHAALLAAPGGD
jgi:hypothetical protein